eukprot:556792-Pyramimonas_sp.AAC.1
MFRRLLGSDFPTVWLPRPRQPDPEDDQADVDACIANLVILADAETSLGQANHSTNPRAMQHQASEAPDIHRFAPLPAEGGRVRCDDLDDPDADPFAYLDDQLGNEGELCTVESNIGCRPDAIRSSPAPSRE